jgi:hypothetical protein
LEKEEPLDPPPTKCMSIINFISSFFEKLPYSTVSLSMEYRNKKHYSTCCLKLASLIIIILISSYIAGRIGVMNAITGINNEMIDFRTNQNMATQYTPLK